MRGFTLTVSLFSVPPSSLRAQRIPMSAFFLLTTVRYWQRSKMVDQIEDYTSIHGPMATCLFNFHFKNARNTLEEQQMVLVELDVCM